MPELRNEHKQRSAAGQDWPILSSHVGKWSQKGANEPLAILVSQITSCAECNATDIAQINTCSIHRASEDFGIAVLSTIWCLPTSSKEVWRMLHQSALENLMKPASIFTFLRSKSTSCFGVERRNNDGIEFLSPAIDV